MSDDNCCEEWQKAQQRRTDNEGYGPLLQRDADEGGAWAMGSRLPPVAFCPWCGARKVPMAPIGD